MESGGECGFEVATLVALVGDDHLPGPAFGQARRT
jgi:hypothetical protein